MGQFSFECTECGGKEQFDWTDNALVELEVSHVEHIEDANGAGSSALDGSKAAAVEPGAEWGLGYRFFVKGEYSTYGSFEFKCGSSVAHPYNSYDDSDTIHFSRGPLRLQAKCRGVRCFGVCHSPSDRTQRFRMCVDGLRGQTIHTKLPTDPGSGIPLAYAYDANQVGKMVAKVSPKVARLNSAASANRQQLEQVEQMIGMMSTPEARRAWVESLIDAAELSPLRQLVQPEGASRSTGFFQELLEGTSIVGPGFDATATSPLVYAARRGEPRILRELLELGASHGVAEALRECEGALPALELAFDELNFKPGAPGAAAAAKHFESCATTASGPTTDGAGVEGAGGVVDAVPDAQPAKIAKTQRHAELVAAEAAVDRCTDCIALLAAAKHEWDAVVTALKAGQEALSAAYEKGGYGVDPDWVSPVESASSSAEFIDDLLVRTRKVWGEERASKLRGPPMVRARRCLDKLNAANVLAREGSFFESQRIRQVAAAAPSRWCEEESDEEEDPNEAFFRLGPLGKAVYMCRAHGLTLSYTARSFGMSETQLMMAAKMGM